MGGCTSSERAPPAPAYTFNFDGEPTTEETEIWTTVSELCVKGPMNLTTLTEYKGCDGAIRAVRDIGRCSEMSETKAGNKRSRIATIKCSFGAVLGFDFD